MVQLKVKKLDPKAVIPTYAHLGEDACLDLTAVSCVYDEATDCYIYGTGLAFEIPQGYMMLVYPRSSNRKTDAYLTNSVGVIDSGYRGEVMVNFKNRTSIDVKNYVEYATDGEGDVLTGAPYEVGDRIAQFMILPYPQVQLIEAFELSKSARMDGGHGSSGK